MKELLKDNLKWIIMGASIIIATWIYVHGTRYQPMMVPGTAVDRMTGDVK